MAADSFSVETSRAVQSRFLSRVIRFRGIMASNPALAAGGLLTIFVVLVAIFGPVILKADPLEMDPGHVLSPPSLATGHLLGTDDFGRDMLVRLVYGARISLLIAWVSVLGGSVIGTVIGLITGHYGGVLDNVVMRIAESVMAFPFVVIALLLASVFIPGPKTLMVVFCILGAPVFAKIIRGVVLSLNRQDFMIAARALGCSDLRLIIRHLLPNVLPQLLIVATLQVSQVIFVEAGLSFIGVGVQPPHPSWGNMLAEGRAYMAIAWWLPVLPGLALLLTILGANLLGDGLQEWLDPKRRLLKMMK